MTVICKIKLFIAFLPVIFDNYVFLLHKMNAKKATMAGFYLKRAKNIRNLYIRSKSAKNHAANIFLRVV